MLILPLSLAIAVAVAIFLLKPAYSELIAVKNTVKEKKNTLSQLENQNQKLQSLKSKYESMAEEKNLVETAFPEKESVDSYISEITSKASRSGVLITGIDKGEKSGGVEGQSASYVCGASLAGDLAQADFPMQNQPANASLPSEAVSVTGAANLPVSCLNTINVSMAAAGSWEQMLEFFKYLEDMNRISNIEAVDLSSQKQSQEEISSDLLSVNISMLAFFKKKSQGSLVLASNLAGQGNFNQKAIEKLKETIYAPYEAPAVSSSGERNIFK